MRPLQRLSLRHKLPLCLTGLTATVLVVAGLLAWGDVRAATRAAGEARLQGTAGEIANLARTGLTTRANLEREVGQHPAIQAALDGAVDEAAVQTALRRLAAPADSGLALELWSADGRRLAGLGSVPHGIDPEPPLGATRKAGEFQKTGEQTVYWTSAPVEVDGQPKGWIARVVRLGNPQTAEQFSRLLGSDISFLFGTTTQRSWADLAGNIVAAPPSGHPVGEIFPHALPDGRPGVALAVPLEGTQWVVMAQMATSVLDERPRAFVRRMLLVGLVLMLATALVGWLMSARLTAPLHAIAGAADELARGAYVQRLPEGQGEDEIARLARAFNSMADQVGRADEALRHRLDEASALAARLEEANVTAELARQEAQDANRAKSEFLATMSHEIRTPINAVIGYTDLMVQGIPDPPTPRQRGYLERIERSSRLLISLVNDVLDFARIESGQMRVQRGVGSAAEAIQTARAALDPQAASKGVILHSGCDGDLLFSADPRRVQQILLNLLTNAVKFTPRGGTVRISGRLDEHGPDGAGGEWLRIDVDDTGIGIPDDQVGRIFEPFVQAETGFTREHGGVGLGLAISRRLATLLQGDITVRSVKGQGSCFTLWLPAVPSATPATV